MTAASAVCNVAVLVAIVAFSLVLTVQIRLLWFNDEFMVRYGRSLRAIGGAVGLCAVALCGVLWVATGSGPVA